MFTFKPLYVDGVLENFVEGVKHLEQSLFKGCFLHRHPQQPDVYNSPAVQTNPFPLLFTL